MEAVVVEMGVRKVMLETLRCSCSETAKTGAVGGVAEGKRLLQAVLVDHQFSSWVHLLDCLSSRPRRRWS